MDGPGPVLDAKGHGGVGGPGRGPEEGSKGATEAISRGWGGDGEVASPQLENGFLRLANEIACALARTTLSPYESRVLWVVIRQTYGNRGGRKMDRISISQFSAMTGIKRRHVHRTLQTLIKRRIVKAKKSGPQEISYGLEKDFEQWEIAQEEVPTVTSTGNTPKDQPLPLQVIGPLPLEVTEPLPLEVPTKDKKIKKDMVPPKAGAPHGSKKTAPWLREFFGFWDTEFKTRFGRAYTFTYGKEGKLVKDALAVHDLPALQALAKRFLAADDPWVRDRGGYTIGVFFSQINKLVSTMPVRTERKMMPL